MTPRVCLLRCADYGQGKERILQALSMLEPPVDFADKKVLLKVNLMKGAPPDRALNTHPEFIRAMIQVVRAQGGTCSVGDSSGLLGFTNAAFQVSGIARVVKEEGAELVNFDAGPLVKVETNGAVLKSFWVSKKVLDADLRISLPKLKTHTLTTLTGAVKNQLGLLPGGTKPALHVLAPGVDSLCRSLVEINRAVQFDFAVMDGITGLEGGGSEKGRPKHAGIILASRDLVALDSVAAKVMGIEPHAVPTNRIGKELGLGEHDLSLIHVCGDDLEACATRFSRPGIEPKKVPLIAWLLYRLRERSVRPLVLNNACTRCMRCVEVCPVDAIALEPTVVLKDHCINCFCCYEQCPEKAIRLVSPWYLRAAVKRKLAGLPIRYNGSRSLDSGARI